MNTIYLDIFSGISGDMFLGALVDLGVDAKRLEEALARLNVSGYHLRVSRQERGAISGIKFDVHLVQPDSPAQEQCGSHAASTTSSQDHGHRHGHHHHASDRHEHHHSDAAAGHAHGAHAHGRTFADIKRILRQSTLSAWVQDKSIAVFERIAKAEGAIHGQPSEKVHFHEVGALDSIVDIVGACVALEMLGKPRVLAGPVVEGTGTVPCAHGNFPLPAPATLEILSARGVAIQQCEEPHELVTPTGAALLAEMVEAFGPMAGLAVRKIGYGLGTRQHRTRPNVLRVLLAEADSMGEDGPDWEADTITVLETNLDDINPEILGHLVTKTLEAGALDVFYTPIQMKKNRPGILLSLLCEPAAADRLTELLLRESTALGVRRHDCDRRKLRREWTTVHTPHGDVTVKLGRLSGVVIQAAPEYDSCKALSDQTGVPLKQIYDDALHAYHQTR